MNIADLDMEALTRLRRHLHAHPELSRREEKTSAHMRAYLAGHAPPDEIIALAGAGFAAVYEGDAPGKTVLIRTELDALPIHDVNAHLPYRSTCDGVGHKCGHDGHMAIVAGLAALCSRRRPARGRVVLLFQPDEETGTGARECCDHPDFARIKPDYAFALHNFPGYPAHEIICRAGPFTSSVRFMGLKLKGREAHSAQPETGANPAYAIAEITQAARGIQDRYDREDEFALIVPVRFEMGVSSSGVAPGYGEAHYTLRTCRNEVVDAMWAELSDAARRIAGQHGLGIDFKILEDFPASENDAEAAAMIRQAAEANGFAYTELEAPRRFGEDFGEITKHYKGAMFGLGAGIDGPQLHNPDYDFPDAIIPTGIAMFMSLIEQALSLEK